jgi:hypothetical protein
MSGTWGRRSFGRALCRTGSAERSGLPDAGELEMDGEDQEGVDEMLQVETLMGWDGDRCTCVDCRCERFRDGEDPRCLQCQAGEHGPGWTGFESYES